MKIFFTILGVILVVCGALLMYLSWRGLPAIRSVRYVNGHAVAALRRVEMTDRAPGNGDDGERVYTCTLLLDRDSAQMRWTARDARRRLRETDTTLPEHERFYT